ncbi:hypothetical protein [Aminobacter sp. AP02]|uniref:hypothetical protein n=1 Tax=Aminobacter sp. AP02 TaxID=2135737 RepID=UPI000D6AD95D|nr:hypothetical protein [Aminobacter sp. AP02]
MFFLLLPVFAVLAGSITSSQPHLLERDAVVQVSAPAPAYQDSDGPLALFACGDVCVMLAEINGDGSDDSALPHIVRSLPIAEIDISSPAIDPLFSFLRDRTSAPRAPPAQV